MRVGFSGIYLASRLTVHAFNSCRTMTTHKVFVYGTLKKGEPNHHWFSAENGQWKFLGNAKTNEKYPLIIGTRYNIPFLLYSPGNGTNVEGEVYEVDDAMLKKLDILEEHPDFYVREVRPVSYSNGESNATTIDCWIYFLKSFKAELLKSTFYANYSSTGSHGLPYTERYLRDPNHPARGEVFQN